MKASGRAQPRLTPPRKAARPTTGTMEPNNDAKGGPILSTVLPCSIPKSRTEGGPQPGLPTSTATLDSPGASRKRHGRDAGSPAPAGKGGRKRPSPGLSLAQHGCAGHRLLGKGVCVFHPTR